MLNEKEEMELKTLLKKQSDYKPLTDEDFKKIEEENEDGWMDFNKLFHVDFNKAWEAVVKHAQRWGKMNHRLMLEIRFLRNKIKELETK